MLDFLKRQKAVLVAIIVVVLGWAGYTVTKEQVTPYVDQALQTTEKAGEVVTDFKETFVEEEVEQIEPAAAASATEDFNKASLISEERRTHILHGDASGGGHLYGTGKPCKSEFPKHWDENTVVKEVELIAANDNLAWRQEDNGYYVTEENVGTIRVRVVKDQDNEQVITAYPTNVQRNPCPANDR